MNPRFYQGIIITILTVSVLNLALLNYRVFFATSLAPEKLSPETLPLAIPSPTQSVRFSTDTSPTNTPSASCSACKTIFADDMKNLEERLNVKIASIQPQTQTNQSIKEYYIPLGTGSTTSDSWQDQTGTDTTINTVDYNSIKEVYFEVNMHIPTKNGQVQARLYNVTDKAIVSGSTVSTDAGVSTKIVSPKINLSLGSKTYRVQMLSTLKYQANLDLARIRIVTQ